MKTDRSSILAHEISTTELDVNRELDRLGVGRTEGEEIGFVATTDGLGIRVWDANSSYWFSASATVRLLDASAKILDGDGGETIADLLSEFGNPDNEDDR